MTLIALGGGRSPGLTTTVHAMALTWPGRPALIAELDPDGGSLAARHGVAPDPGLVSLAAAARRGLRAGDVVRHCRQLSDATRVVLGPPAPDQAASALVTLGDGLGPALAALPDVDVLADLGRLDGRRIPASLLDAALVLLLVVEPTVEGVAHLSGRLATLPVPAGRLALITVGDRPYRPTEVAGALGVPLLGVIAWDTRGATRLAEGRPDRRSPLLRSAAATGAALIRRLGIDPITDPGVDDAGRAHDPGGGSSERGRLRWARRRPSETASAAPPADPRSSAARPGGTADAGPTDLADGEWPTRPFSAPDSIPGPPGASSGDVGHADSLSSPA